MVASWAMQMLLKAHMLYVSYSVIVRYVYILNQRMILEDVSDRTMQNAVRAFTLGLSGLICLILHLNRFRPKQYIGFVGKADKHVSEYRSNSNL